jgi:hypothetical protein
MPLTDAERINQLAAKLADERAQGRRRDEEIAALKAGQERIEALLLRRLPPEPKPDIPPKPPAWAQSKPNTGMAYTGPPGPPSGGTNLWGGYRKQVDANGNWRDPSGIWRSAEGEIITPASLAPRPVGPERTHAHEEGVRFADKVFSDQEQQP